MKGIESTDIDELHAINKKINDAMKLSIQNYNATQWGEILQHPTENKFLLVINDDERKPISKLLQAEKTKVKNHKEKDWYTNDQ